jgi:HSP20 family protein
MADNKKKEHAPVARRRDWPGWLESPFVDWPRLRSVFAEDEGVMRVENFTEGNEAVVRVEMPGIDPDKDVEITVSDHSLRVHAERREESRTDDQGNYRSEFRYGSFTRVVPMPAGATDKDVTATYMDGILEVRLPIDRAVAAASKIPIQRA